MTIREIAKLAGVSVSTVSKIMNGKDESIRSETREHVLQIAKEYNYKPYASIMTSYSAKSLCIGIVLRNAEEIHMYASGILTAVQNNGYFAVFRESNNSSEEELKNISALISMNVDGILLEPVIPECSSSIKQLQAAAIPYLLFNTDHTDSHNLNFQQMGYDSTKVLINSGHKEIACLIDETNNSLAFLHGYQQCLFECNISLNEDLIFQEGTKLPSERLSSHLFSGIIIFRYSTAVQFVKTAEALHYHIPCDYSVVSLKSDAATDYFPALSSLVIPYTTFAHYIAELLIQKIEKKTVLPSPMLISKLNHTHSIDIPYHSRAKRVISLGSINIDNYMNFQELPHTGKTVTSPTSVTLPGGKCINETIGVCKLGHPSCAIGCVGDDSDADFLYQYAQSYLADTSGIKRSKGQKTGQAYIFVQEDGNSMISIMSGANNCLSSTDVAESEHLFLNASFCLMQTEVPMDALIKAGELSRKYGLTTVLKPSACSQLPEKLLTFIDILVPNLDELNEICPGNQTMEEKADFFLSHGIQTVIVTLGDKGCYIHSASLSCNLPAIDVVTVDSSGAGDAFICALVSYLLYDYSLVSAAKIANYAAGLSTTRQGTTSALVDRHTLESYIRRSEPELL